ncbi:MULTISPECIES: porin [unclassified Janthinobacterium]|uniref:porin n=1 Tax=unclassified Janthinobacterium TaxID=2610881 RepID=UPI0025B19138|nr:MULTISPECIES: porin [unclassified Janthinobacterium]MDN2717342.1 porin [Janthinobacterium sp. SUN120]MDO8041773.1 porin [Janthinobacterium sp. SUN137]MDO8049390.1 porin [Janthinobacterium sp. SUN211]
MKKSLVALALFGAFAATAQAQSSVQIYGTIDAGLGKATGSTTAVTKRDNNKLGFKGTEDLGNGLKAIFQLEIRYESDTGTLESNSRPLFQGQSRVGLQGDFGTVRLGRGLTAFQESSTAFEPWSGMPTQAGFQTDLTVAAYTSDPLSADGNSRNRFSNAVFYNSPVISGFQFNATVAAKEANNNTAVPARPPVNPITFASGNYALLGNAVPASNPYSISATYTNEQFAAMAAYERNGVQAKLWSVAASFNPIKELKLMASYQHQDDGNFKIINTDTKSWVLGANYDVGPGKIRAGYGQKTPDGVVKTKQASLGYDYNLSKRTYLYADISNKKAAAPNSLNYTVAKTVNYIGIGVHHNF